MAKTGKKWRGKPVPAGSTVSREALRAREGEEFISPEATPSRDPNDLPCARCGKPREAWDGPGMQKEGRVYCSEACAKGKR